MRSIRYLPLVLVIAIIPIGVLVGLKQPFAGGLLFGIGLLGSAVGIYDLSQRNHAVLKNYPLIARLRFLLEGIRPEIRQYFLESDHDEVPVFPRATGFGLQTSQGDRGPPSLWHAQECAAGRP